MNVASIQSNCRIPFQTIKNRASVGNSGIGGFTDSSFNTAKKFFQQGTEVTVRFSKVVLGLLGVVGGAVAAAIFKENTAADWGSKALMIIGAILGVLGVKDLINFNKDLSTKIEPEKCETAVSKPSGLACKKAAAELSKPQHDPQFTKKYDPSNPGAIRLNKANPDLRKAASELLGAYINPELIQHAGTYRKGVEYTITNIDASNVSLAEYGDRIVTLLGYVFASIGASNQIEPEFQAILDDINNYFNGSFDYEASDKRYVRVLPTDFVDAYASSRWFLDHKGKNNSIKDLIGNKDEKIALLTKCLKSTGIGPTRKEALEYLTSLQKAQNYLGALNKIICYVLDPKNLSDPAKARNVIVLRQALICGLGLKGQNLDDIHNELNKVLQGEEISPDNTSLGLQDKLKELNEYMQSEKMASLLNNEKLPFLRNSTRISDPVLGDMSWYEIVEKKPVANDA